jgi:hypothetical protein
VQPIRHIPDRDRLSVLTAVILLAYALARLLDVPARVFDTTLFGSPLGFELNGPVLMMILVAALISAGSDTLIRSHPRLASRPDGARAHTVQHWIMPGATALALGGLLNRAPDGVLWWLGLGVSAIVLIAVLIAEYTLVDRADAAWQFAALSLTALAYALALVLFALLHSLSARALISASGAGLAGGLLALRLFALKAAPVRPALLYAGVVALVVAEATWALNYWRVASSSAALLAMIPFYLAAGLAQQHFVGRLTRRIWVEYGVVGALALAVALLYAF